MLSRTPIGTVALIAALATAVTSAAAFDESKYPDWGGQWLRPRGVGIQWDQGKRPGLAQQAPLRPEYQKILEGSMADQRNGGQGIDNRFTCMTNGMPRMMAAIAPIEFVILPAITYVHFEAFMPRRIYTDGREFPNNEEPSLAGYSIGHWSDTDRSGRFDTLEVETRNFKGPRTVESTGIPLSEDNRTIVKEKIYLDKADPDIMHNIITIIDDAFTHPWTVTTSVRSVTLPDIPPLSEFLPGYESSAWFGFGAPKETSIEIIDRLNREINAGLGDANVKARLADLGAARAENEWASFCESAARRRPALSV
jgi:hypothetical protein